MDNYNAGTIWEVKSLNENEEYYSGMSCGTSTILIIEILDNNTFKYLKVSRIPRNNRTYCKLKRNNKYIYIQNNRIMTGSTLALNRYIFSINNHNMDKIINSIQNLYK